jgi:hypothetical protein
VAYFFEGLADPLPLRAVLTLLQVALTVSMALTVFHQLVRRTDGVPDRWRYQPLKIVALQALVLILLWPVNARLDDFQRAKIIGLETRIARRTLTDSEIAEMAKSLEQYAPQEFEVAGYGNEPGAFAARVKMALEKAGWMSPYRRYPAFHPQTVGTGIDVWVNPGDRSTEDAAERLIRFLRAKAIAAELKTFEPPSPNMTAKIGIFIADRF